MLKSLHEELGKAPAAAASPRCARSAGCRQRAAQAAAGRSRDNPATATFHRRRAAQQAGLRERNLASRFRSRGARARLRRRRFLRHLSDQRSRAGRRRSSRRSKRRAGSCRSASKTLREILDRRRFAVARARHAVSAFLLSHRRRAAAESEGAGGGRRSGWRRGDARRACGAARNSPAFGPIRKPSSRRSSRCSRGFIRSRRRPKRRPGRSRSRSMLCATSRQARSASASPRPSSPSASRRGDQLKVYVQKAHAFGLPPTRRRRSS